MSSTSQVVSLVRMDDSHLANTGRWLRDSSNLREQVDCLRAPTEEGNRAYWHSKWQDSRREDYAIVTTADNSHIGNCGLCDIDQLRQKAQLWIYLGEVFGQGAGTIAVTQLLNRGFGSLNLERIYLRVVASNQRALRFYQKLGFVEEGRFRRDTLVDGEPVDAICMAMLKSEYQRAPEGGVCR
jgi:RimJ/RimL family protein N-acetyltransferase